ncbi:APO protein 4, mitochondrial isoform X1 [Phragmites australis]|uniref:APO protein 4, mitochondrial isoform X1 n=1 Tax=Phragmites australis TaxID=29695 RepID=UPI002D7A104E|nr:APO protein 4, mitochondrial isoform X1 [Phragmites australis]
MASLGRRVGSYICSELCGPVMNKRLYSSSRVDWKQLRPMILKRIKNRAKDYPIKRMIPVAEEVIRTREIVTEGVSTLLKVVPVHSCKVCPEVHIGAVGHQMKTCHGFKRMIKDQPHKWGPGNLNDILAPVQAFHLKYMFQDEIKHDQRFDFTRVPAVLELCHQAGAVIPDVVLYKSDQLSTAVKGNCQEPASFLPDELRYIGQRTLDAWESLRLGVMKLLLVYPSKVCEHCSEVHVGPSGHKARMCGVFKFEGWKGMHKWKKAGVDDLIPPKIVWHQRPHDPPVLVDGGRDYYGHAPAVIELCMKVGAQVPPKYRCMMKTHGLAPPVP